MSRSQNKFIKLQKERRKQQKKKAKQERKKERQKNNLKGADLSDMIAHVDEYGNIIPDSSQDDEEKHDKEDTDKSDKTGE